MCAWLLGLMLLATPAVEPPAADVEQAKALYEAGSEAYRQGQYEVAIRAFEEALRLAAHPSLEFSAAQAYRLQFFIDQDLRKLERAVDLYRAYLQGVPSGGRRDHAAQHLSTLEPLLEQRRIEATGGESVADSVARLIVSSRIEGATARIDDGEPAAIPAAFEVEPGERTVHVEAPEHLAETLETVAVAGSVVALNVELRPAPGRLAVRAPEGAAIFVDRQPVGRAPLAEPLAVPPGSHLLAVTANGRRPFVQQVELGRGQAAEVDAPLGVTTQRWTAWTLFGVAGGALAAGGVTLALSLDREDEAADLEARHDRQGLTVAEADRYADLEAERDTYTAWTIGLGSAAGVALVTATLLWIFDEPDIAGVGLAPAPPGHGGGGLRVFW